MTPKERAVMQQALEALEKYNSKHRHTYGLDGAWDEEITKGERSITALREALAEQANNWPENEEHKRQLIEGQRKWLAEQAEQEPVAFHDLGRAVWAFNVLQLKCKDKEFADSVEEYKKALMRLQDTKLYAAPVRTKDLTDDEILACGGMDGADDWAFEFARAVIAADREKNK